MRLFGKKMSGSPDHSYPFCPVPFSFIPALMQGEWDLFWKVIQAYVFAVLSLVYISSAASIS